MFRNIGSAIQTFPNLPVCITGTYLQTKWPRYCTVEPIQSVGCDQVEYEHWTLLWLFGSFELVV